MEGRVGEAVSTGGFGDGLLLRGRFRWPGDPGTGRLNAPEKTDVGAVKSEPW